MKYFAGLDVSLEETAICIVDEAGEIVREARVASEPDALVVFFGTLGKAMERVGLEACSLSAWLHRELSEAGIPAVCIETRQAKAAMGAMPNKTDRKDAYGIAQHCARKKPALPFVACFTDGAPNGAEQATRRRERRACVVA